MEMSRNEENDWLTGLGEPRDERIKEKRTSEEAYSIKQYKQKTVVTKKMRPINRIRRSKK